MPRELLSQRGCHAPQPRQGAAQSQSHRAVKGLPPALAARASSEGALLGAPGADSGDGAGQDRSQSGGGLWDHVSQTEGSPGGSAGKESACNAEDPSLIPGLGRSPGGGKGSVQSFSRV